MEASRDNRPTAPKGDALTGKLSNPALQSDELLEVIRDHLRSVESMKRDGQKVPPSDQLYEAFDRLVSDLPMTDNWAPTHCEKWERVKKLIEETSLGVHLPGLSSAAFNKLGIYFCDLAPKALEHPAGNSWVTLLSKVDSVSDDRENFKLFEGRDPREVVDLNRRWDFNRVVAKCVLLEVRGVPGVAEKLMSGVLAAGRQGVWEELSTSVQDVTQRRYPGSEILGAAFKKVASTTKSAGENGGE